jgi:cell division protein FtsW
MGQQTKQLRHIYYGLILVFAILLLLGLVNVYSSTFVGDRVIGNTYYHLFRQIMIIAVGIFPTWFIYRVDYTFWKRHLPIICIGTVILLGLVYLIGISINGARRWLGVAFITFQPSELAKLVGIIYAASLLADSLNRGRPIELMRSYSTDKRAPFWQRVRCIPELSLWIPLLFAGMVAKQPDAGTALVIFVIPLVMALVSGAHITKAKIPILLCAGAGFFYMMAAAYRRNRIISWFDPWSYEKTLGYQTVQGLIAIGSGGITGQGVGTGISKFSYLPEAHTDFAFAIFAQEWGLLGSIAMLTLFAVIVVFGCRCALQTKDKFGKLLALGVTLYMGGQGFINIAMVSGALPVVGVPLPFISYGGTSLIVNMAAAALLLNIAKRNLVLADREAPKEEQVQPPSIREETKSHFPLR